MNDTFWSYIGLSQPVYCLGLLYLMRSGREGEGEGEEGDCGAGFKFGLNSYETAL